MIEYAPIIADTIPAFAPKEAGEELYITVPFTHNIAVPKAAVEYMVVIVRDMQSNYIDRGFAKAGIDYNEGKVTFNMLKETRFQSNVWYKFQIAYTDDKEITSKGLQDIYALNFSTVAVGKCIERPLNLFNLYSPITNKPFTSGTVHDNTVSYIGKYENNISEPLYEYRFHVREVNNGISTRIIQDTGWVQASIEDATVNNNKVSFEHIFILKSELENNPKTYRIYYSIRTVNGYEDQVVYRIRKGTTYPIPFFGQLIASQDQVAKDNGYINLTIVLPEGTQAVKGSFELLRTSDNLNWDTLTTFHTTSNSENYIRNGKFNWKDYSIEQGVKYTYAIRQYVPDDASQYAGIRTDKTLSTPIVSEFEDMFLSDGYRQLRIQYNPKVSSFKDTILESKTDTIGGKYPFFFRNGNVRYKEIPISGLISYLMDANNEFQFKKIAPEDATINLTNENFATEREFKLAVLEWLTNGQPKLFRSPAEGNYVVRLMNVSLAPQDQLGRMLHTFSSTGYECMDNDFDTLVENSLVEFEELSDVTFNPTQTETQIFTSENIGQTITIEGQLTNISWVSYPPSIDKSIIVDNEVFHNPTGVLEFSRANKIEVEVTNSFLADTITYDIPKSINSDNEIDELIDMVDNKKTYTSSFNVQVNEKDKFYLDIGRQLKTYGIKAEKIYKYISINCIPNGISDINTIWIDTTGVLRLKKNALGQIMNNSFNIEETSITPAAQENKLVSSREFRNLPGNTTILLGSGLTAQVVCEYKKQPTTLLEEEAAD